MLTLLKKAAISTKELFASKAELFLRFFQPSSKQQESLNQTVTAKLDCHLINRDSGVADPKRRAEEFAKAAPNCICELQTTSPHSPGAIESSEILTRFIFSPVHVRKKIGDVMPSAFSHANTSGCSVQRENLATANELTLWLKKYLENNTEHRWVGTLNCTSDSIKAFSLNDSSNRAVGVYDTAECENPAHAEIFKTEYVIEEADSLEVKRELLRKFNSGVLTKPTKYRSGHLFSSLPEVLRAQASLS